MEYLLEFILEIALEASEIATEGSFEAGKNKKIPKYIRYPLIVIISLIYIAIIGLILVAGILSLKDETLVGIILILIGLSMLIVSIIKIRKMYCAYGKKW